MKREHHGDIVEREHEMVVSENIFPTLECTIVFVASLLGVSFHLLSLAVYRIVFYRRYL